MYDNLLKQINKYDQIVIFRHVRPDGDCAFSSLALYNFLKDNFKDKKIKLAGNEVFDLIDKKDKVSDKFILNSLAIVCDTATTTRVDDFRCMAAKYVVKIDHHPPVENYGDINIVKPEYSSTCEVLSEILMSNAFKKYKISNLVYKYLYCGMVTDTLNFRTANTSYKTLSTAAKLVEKGGLLVSDLVEWLTDSNLETYKKITKIRNKLIVKNKFGYIKLNTKELKEIGLDPVEAKNNIDEIGTISDLNIWAFAVENNGAWDASLRSKRPYIINKFAAKYSGGGHANACAVKHINCSQLESLFKELIEFSTK